MSTDYLPCLDCGAMTHEVVHRIADAWCPSCGLVGHDVGVKDGKPYEAVSVATYRFRADRLRPRWPRLGLFDSASSGAFELESHAELGGPAAPFVCSNCGDRLFGQADFDVEDDDFRVHCFVYTCARCGPCACDQVANRFYPAAHGHSGWCFCPVGHPCRFCAAEDGG